MVLILVLVIVVS